MFDVPRAATVVAWIERSAGPGARVVRVEPLPRSSTARHLVHLDRAGRAAELLLLRRFDDRRRLAADPWYQPAAEVAALERLAATAIPAPRLVAADLPARVADVPALLVTWLPGAPLRAGQDLGAFLARAAEALVAIHAAGAGGLRPYAPYEPEFENARLPAGADATLWDGVAITLGREPPAHREVFIHRDYHPDNVLWDGTRITGVVDWTAAARGPAGIDLARMRLNLAIEHGYDAADRFVAEYRAAGGDALAWHPWWDLRDAADLVADLAGGDPLARTEAFAARALAEFE